MNPLTDDQKRLVESNLGLAYNWCYRRTKPHTEHRDITLSDCYLGLVEAASKYEPWMGKFRTVAIYYMRKAIQLSTIYRVRPAGERFGQRNSKKPVPDSPVSLSYENEPIACDPGYQKLEDADFLSHLMLRLTEYEKEVLIAKVDRTSYTDLGNLYGLTPALARRMTEEARKSAQNIISTIK